MACMLHALPEQIGHVLIVQAVEHLAANFARLDQAHVAQAAHLVRDSRLANAHRFNQRPDIHLAVYQSSNDPHAAGIAQCAKEFSDGLGRFFSQVHGL